MRKTRSIMSHLVFSIHLICKHVFALLIDHCKVVETIFQIFSATSDVLDLFLFLIFANFHILGKNKTKKNIDLILGDDFVLLRWHIIGVLKTQSNIFN